MDTLKECKPLQRKLRPYNGNREADRIESMVKRLIETGETFAVWGAGNTGQGAIRYLREHSGGKLEPQCVIDNNPSLWGQENVMSPDAFFNGEMPDILFVCSYVADQIVAQVKENNKFTGEIVVFSMLALTDNKKMWELYEKNFPALEEIYLLLEEERSRQSLEGFLNSISSGDVSYLERINGDSREKLLDPFILQYSSDEVYVDVGAFTGDTILKFLELTDNCYKKIVGFEMDSRNYTVLQKNTENLRNVKIYNAAAGAYNGKMHFWSGRSESSVLSEQGDSEVGVLALDNVREAEDATFIKISANGKELFVLQGAEKLLVRNKPKLAVYASGELLWKIPQYLRQTVPEYKLFYRHYGYGQQAMICYARLPNVKPIGRRPEI